MGEVEGGRVGHLSREQNKLTTTQKNVLSSTLLCKKTLEAASRQRWECGAPSHGPGLQPWLVLQTTSCFKRLHNSPLHSVRLAAWKLALGSHSWANPLSWHKVSLCRALFPSERGRGMAAPGVPSSALPPCIQDWVSAPPSGNTETSISSECQATMGFSHEAASLGSRRQVHLAYLSGLLSGSPQRKGQACEYRQSEPHSGARLTEHLSSLF